MDLFDSKNIKPMLIANEGKAFDSEDYLFELKLDGERCIAYLNKNGTELRNKRNVNMLSKVPELSNIHKCVDKKCILDGELVVIKNGVPVFSEIQARSLMSNIFKIELAAKKSPASFVAYDILYYEDRQVADLPLVRRKELLQKVIKTENELFALSRVIEGQGKALYELAKQKNLEGIVAKKKESRYHFNKRTKDWIKIKYLKDDDFVVCGYIYKGKGLTSIVLGQYRDNELVYKGHVTMSISREDFKIITEYPVLAEIPFKELPSGGGNEQAIWLKPDLVCTVKYMMLTQKGSMRQAVFKGLRMDKKTKDCII